MSTENLDALGQVLLERYSLLRELGRGGMATVYLAHDRKHDRHVAVKVLHPELSASIGAERFLREIQLAATLQHPHVLGLYDSGSAGGMLYYVMPFVEGESLRHRLTRESQLPVDVALLIAAEVANALGYAHSQGVVHRDIKPENILLSNGHAVVADFGIARATSSDERLTETGIAVGTPQYMSPEQGMGANIGPASDVYALGCLLYEMLAGEPPYTGPNATAIIAKHAMAEVPSLRVVRPGVPEDVEYVVQRALAKSPADRWPNAAELERAIRSAAASYETGSRPGMRTPSGSYGAGAEAAGGVAVRPAPSRALRRTAVGLTVVAGAALAGAGFVARDRLPLLAHHVAAAADPMARHLAVLYFDVPEGDASLRPVADGLTESLTNALAQVPELLVVSTGGTLPLRDAHTTLDSAARALSVGTLVTGRVEREAQSQVRVTLTLRDASGAAFADTSLVLPAAALLRLRDAVIDDAAALVRQRLGSELTLRASRAGTSDADAWALVQRGIQQGRAAESASHAGDAAATARADSAADAMLAAAEARDPAWGAPPLERARLAYRQSRRRGSDPEYAAPILERGLALADRAVARDSTAAALEVRGTMRYWQWLLKLGPTDPMAREAQLERAQHDLETATTMDPTLADAWASLSHLYIQHKTLLDAKLAATNAYQHDPYLVGADRLLFRLYSLSYDLGQFVDARRYCAEFARRFPDDPNRALCGLALLSVPDAPPAPPTQVWQLVAERERLAPAPQRAFIAAQSRMYAASALAHAGLRDSARRVVAQTLAVAPPSPDGELPMLGAWAYLEAGDKDRAFDTMKQMLDGQGALGRRGIGFDVWWWRDVKNDPRWRRLEGT